ncbi:MAG: DUF2637 domain-containing protein [Streptosporangiaceae bacterium]
MAVGECPVSGDKLTRWTAVLAVLAVAAVAAVISYRHAVTMVAAHGEPGLVGHLYPVVIDGLIVAASMVLLDAARHQERAPGPVAVAARRRDRGDACRQRAGRSIGGPGGASHAWYAQRYGSAPGCPSTRTKPSVLAAPVITNPGGNKGHGNPTAGRPDALSCGMNATTRSTRPEARKGPAAWWSPSSSRCRMPPSYRARATSVALVPGGRSARVRMFLPCVTTVRI